MAGIFDSYKKIYENKKIHIWLFIIALLWTVSSFMFDIATGRPNNPGQNIFDILFGIFTGVYSLQFLHNAIHNINGGVLPSFKEIKGKTFVDMIKLDIVWFFYAIIIIMTSVVLYFTLIHTIIFPIAIISLTVLAAMFVYYIYIAYAENMETKGLFNIVLLFRFIKPAFKDTLIKVCIFILATLLAVLICILIYAAAAITGLDTIGHVAADYYVLDFIIFIIAAYFMVVTWYFAYPYSLIDTYIEKIRPVLRKEENNGENV